MQDYYVDVRTVSPLTIRADHAQGEAATTSYIPGSTLMGGLADAHRLLHPRETAQFQRLFLSEHILFPNLYPALFLNEGLQEADLPVLPVPRTAQSCKRYKGFLFPPVLLNKDENDAHGVRDSLTDWAVYALAQHYKTGNILAALENKEHKACTRCNATMDVFKGHYRRNEKHLIEAKAHTRLQTHSGINRESGTVQDGILYSRQVFEEGMRFWGTAKFPEDERLYKEFSDFLNDLSDPDIGNDELLRLGTGRTRGMGLITIDVRRSRTQSSFGSFKNRLQAFDNLVHEVAKDSGLSVPPDTFFFALTLHSPLLLLDELLRYRGSIDANCLTRLLNEDKIPGLHLLYQNARTQRVRGWQQLWGVPRTSEYAISTGSVFLFTCTSPKEELFKKLFALEDQGGGKRRAEGFGRIRISDEFHQEIKAV